MRRCQEHSTDMLLYLDNALTGQKLEEFRAHLAACPNCREHLEEERALSCLLRQTRPLYSALQTLRDRLTATMEHQAFAGPRVSDPSSQKARMRNPRSWLLDLWRATFRWKSLAVTMHIFALSVVFIPAILQKARATDYIEAATRIHRRYTGGRLPLQCRTRSPEEVTTWLAGKTPFDFRLPASQSLSNSKPEYWLAGASLVSYKENPAAFVAYETSTEKISLVIAPSNSAVGAGGEEVRSGNLAFHYRSDSNFQVITWTNHGLTYALVPPPTGSPRHSCLVCHQNMADLNFFKH